MIPPLGLVIPFANIVTPVVGVLCGRAAQTCYLARLKELPPKVAEGMPKRFPMADLLICLFMLGPILGILNMLASTSMPMYFPPTPLAAALRWLTLVVLVPINFSGPQLIKIGMPPDGSFALTEKAAASPAPTKPTLAPAGLFDAREI